MKKNKLCALGMALDFYQVELGYSNDRLMLFTGIDKSAIGRHKSGASNPTLTTLETYARFLKVKLSDIVLKMEGFQKKNEGEIY